MKITQINSDEFRVDYNGEHWYTDKFGNGSLPEKYWDTQVEADMIALLPKE